MFSNRGQGAMEYLSTYAWAIIAVLIVGVVLWQMGVFKDSDEGLTHSGFTKLKPHMILSDLTADGVLTLVVLNGVEAPLKVMGVKVWDLDSDTVLCCSHDNDGECTGAGVNGAASDIQGFDHSDINWGDYPTIGKNENFVIEMGRTGTHNPAGTAASSCRIPGGAVGDDYKIKVFVEYEARLKDVFVPSSESGIIEGALK